MRYEKFCCAMKLSFHEFMVRLHTRLLLPNSAQYHGRHSWRLPYTRGWHQSFHNFLTERRVRGWEKKAK
jgi:hypothetical protein